MTIREHPLAWRWADPNHAVLPDEVLERMIAFAPGEAAGLFKRASGMNGAGGLSTDLFEVNVISTVTTSLAEGSAWLRGQQPDAEAKVYLSWQADTAIQTTWGTFADYWSDFCYPSSDDLNVWPEDEAWAFLFHHEEEFQFGRRVQR